MHLSAKVSDNLHLVHEQTESEHHGYVPECCLNVGEADGFLEDYLYFSVCLDCGQLQGEFPAPPLPELGESATAAKRKVKGKLR